MVGSLFFSVAFASVTSAAEPYGLSMLSFCPGLQLATGGESLRSVACGFKDHSCADGLCP